MRAGANTNIALKNISFSAVESCITEEGSPPWGCFIVFCMILSSYVILFIACCRV